MLDFSLPTGPIYRKPKNIIHVIICSVAPARAWKHEQQKGMLHTCKLINRDVLHTFHRESHLQADTAAVHIGFLVISCGTRFFTCNIMNYCDRQNFFILARQTVWRTPDCVSCNTTRWHTPLCILE